MTTIELIDTKQYFLTPTENNLSINYNYPLNSKMRYHIHNLIENNKNILYLSAKISHCEIPYSFYIINEYNNALIINDIKLTLSFGNYNAIDLLNKIYSLMTDNNINATLYFDSSNGKYSLKSNNSFTVKESNIYKIIGLEKGNYNGIINLESNLFELYFTYPVNTGGIRNIYIKTNLITENRQLQSNNNGILKSLPVNVPPYGIIMYNNNENISSIVKNKDLSYLDIELLDDEGNYIDFNGFNWSICLEIQINKKYYSYNFDLNEQIINKK